MVVDLAQRVFVKGLSDEDTALVNRLLGEITARRPRNELRDAYYDFKHVTRQVSSVVPQQYHRLGQILGWAGTAVDKLNRRVNLDGFEWADGDIGSIGYREVWDDNMLGSEVDQAISSELVHSTTFGVVTRGGDGEPPALIHFKTALDATGDWDGRLRRMKNLLSITGRDDKGSPTGMVLYLDGVTVPMSKDAGVWSVEERQEHAWGVPVERMAYKPRLNRPFGRSRISRPIMGLQDAAAREAIRLEGHMDIFSFPELWMLGADEKIFKDASGNPIPKWQVMLGRIKGIPDDEDAANPRADVKQFSASSPEPHLAALNAYAKMFAREADLPDVSVAITDVANPTSAEAYDAGQRDLVTEAEGVADDNSPALRRLAMKALAIAAGESSVPPAYSTVSCKWRDPRYESRAAAADAGSKQVAAVPWLAETEVGLELLGLKPQQVKAALAERRRMELNGRMDNLAELAGADDSDAADVKAKADAMGVLIRSGVSPEDAAVRVGLAGLEFTGAVPTSLRQPESAAADLEQA